MKYFKSKLSGATYRLIHRGENYVFGVDKGSPDCKGFTATLIDGNWEEWVEEPQVGDTVKVKGDRYNHHRTLFYIHQKEGDDRRWGVVAFEGDIPKVYYMRDLEKV